MFCMVRGRWLKLRCRTATGAGVNYEEARQRSETNTGFTAMKPAVIKQKLEQRQGLP